MSDDAKLAVEDTNHGYRIGYYFSDEGEFGLMIGESRGHKYRKKPPEAYSEDNEAWIATYAIAMAFPDVECGLMSGFKFDSAAQAKKALAIAKRAISDAKAKRTPEPWEALALAAGWTPPKGKR